MPVVKFIILIYNTITFIKTTTLFTIMDKQTDFIQELDAINNTNALECSIDELNQYLPTCNPSISIITQNIRSVHKDSNIADLDINLSSLHRPIDVIVLTECRIDYDKPLPHRDNYKSHCSKSKINQNDGVVVFVRDSIQHSIREISIHGASCLEVTTPTCTIICIYRTHSEKTPNNFITALDLYLSSAQLGKNVILTGDININIMDGNNDPFSDLYLDMLASHCLLPGHRFDTRINSCLDHVFINIDNSYQLPTVAVLDTTITDHKMALIYLYCKTIKTQAPTHRTITNYPDAYKSLQNKNISQLIDIQDPNYLANKLINIISECLVENTKTIKFASNKRIIKPWITPGIVKCIKNRNNLQKKLRKDETNEILRLTYRRYRNFCNNLIKKLKKLYERDLLEKSKTNNKSLWKCIKNLTHQKWTEKY